jgi:hypothetical protein
LRLARFACASFVSLLMLAIQQLNLLKEPTALPCRFEVPCDRTLPLADEPQQNHSPTSFDHPGIEVADGPAPAGPRTQSLEAKLFIDSDLFGTATVFQGAPA